MKLVIVNGFHRTGSTLVYNIVREMLQAKGFPFESNPGAGTEGIFKIIGDQCTNRRWMVVKTHRWLPSGLEPHFIKPIFTMRNPFDTAASLIRKPDGHLTEDQVIEELIRQRFGNAYMLKVKNSLVLKYGMFYERINELIVAIERFLGFTINREERENIIKNYHVSNVKTMCDQISSDCDWTTSFRKGHITSTLGLPGAYKNVLSEDMIYKIRAFVLMEKLK